MSTPAPGWRSYSDTDRDVRIALISCTCVVVVLIAFRRCTRKVPSATVNNPESRGDIVFVPQERVIRVDNGDLGKLEFAE